MKTKEQSWMKSLFAYAEDEKKKLVLSVVLSVVSVSAGYSGAAFFPQPSSERRDISNKSFGFIPQILYITRAI